MDLNLSRRPGCPPVSRQAGFLVSFGSPGTDCWRSSRARADTDRMTPRRTINVLLVSALALAGVVAAGPARVGRPCAHTRHHRLASVRRTAGRAMRFAARTARLVPPARPDHLPGGGPQSGRRPGPAGRRPVPQSRRPERLRRHVRRVRRPDLLPRAGQALRPDRHRPARLRREHADPLPRRHVPRRPYPVPPQRAGVPRVPAEQRGVRPRLPRRHRTSARPGRHGVRGPRPRGRPGGAGRAVVQLARAVLRHPDRHAVRQPVPRPGPRHGVRRRSWTTAWAPSGCCSTRRPPWRTRSTGSPAGAGPPRSAPCTDATSAPSTTVSRPAPTATRYRLPGRYGR